MTSSFFSDSPNLIKTVKICWASKNRLMWVRGSWYCLRHAKSHTLCVILTPGASISRSHAHLQQFSHLISSDYTGRGFGVASRVITPHAQRERGKVIGRGVHCDRLWEKGAYGAENKNVVFNLF